METQTNDDGDDGGGDMPELSPSPRCPLQAVAPPKDLDPFVRKYTDFISLGGTPFSQDATSAVTTAINADYWIRQCEKIFKRMTLTEVEKCHLAVHQLDKLASDWWYFITDFIDRNACTWAEFRAKFEARFMPPFIMSEIADDFFMLTQGEMTVMEYASHFTKLSHYAPIPEYRKNEIFIRGLSSSSKCNLLPLVKDSFSRVLNLAMEYERIDAQFVREEAGTHSGQGFRHHPYGGTSGGQSNGRGQKYQHRRHRGYQNSGEFRRHAPLAHALPVRPHIPPLPVPAVAATDAQPTFTCFRCGDPSHRIRDCPMSDLEHGIAHRCSQGRGQYHGPVPVDGRASTALATDSNVGAHNAAGMHNHYGSGDSLHSQRFIKTEYGPTSSSRDRAIKWTCTVCMEQMKEETSTLCGHIFCKSCIIHTIRNQKKCPTCRQDISMDHIHRIYLPGAPS